MSVAMSHCTLPLPLTKERRNVFMLKWARELLGSEWIENHFILRRSVTIKPNFAKPPRNQPYKHLLRCVIPPDGVRRLEFGRRYWITGKSGNQYGLALHSRTKVRLVTEPRYTYGICIFISGIHVFNSTSNARCYDRVIMEYLMIKGDEARYNRIGNLGPA